MLASGLADDHLQAHLRELLLASIFTRPEGNRWLEADALALRADGSPPSLTEATARALLALSDQEGSRTLQNELGSSLLSSYSPSTGFGDPRTGLAALSAGSKEARSRSIWAGRSASTPRWRPWRSLYSRHCYPQASPKKVETALASLLSLRSPRLCGSIPGFRPQGPLGWTKTRLRARTSKRPRRFRIGGPREQMPTSLSARRDISRLLELFPIKLIGGFIALDDHAGCTGCSFCLSRRHPLWRLVFSQNLHHPGVFKDASQVMELLETMRPFTQARVPLRFGHNTDARLQWRLGQELYRLLPESNPFIFILLYPFPFPRRPTALVAAPATFVEVTWLDAAQKINAQESHVKACSNSSMPPTTGTVKARPNRHREKPWTKRRGMTSHLPVAGRRMRSFRARGSRLKTKTTPSPMAPTPFIVQASRGTSHPTQARVQMKKAHKTRSMKPATHCRERGISMS